MSRFWYAYKGTGSETDALNYSLVPWSPRFICLGGSAICAIYSLPNSLNPDLPVNISRNMVSYITASKALFDKYPNDGLHKPFVYSRPIAG